MLRNVSRARGRRRAALTALGALALVAPLLPATAASGAAALPPTQDPREFACPPGQVPDAGFSDIAESVFQLEVNCLVGYGISSGVTADRYDPHGVVTRVQMAQFIARVATGVAGLTLDARDAGFTDLDGLSSEAKSSINGLANAGIVAGTTATTYAPQDGVKREQLATFLVRLQEKVGAAFAQGEDYFTDDSDSVHEANINRLAGAGIVTGTGGGGYAPRGSVTRQQMSGFLMRYVEDRVKAGDLEGRYERDNEVLVVTPDTDASLPVAGDPDDSADDREYAVSGLRDGVQYRITLLDAGTVREENGVTRFTDSDGNGLAEVGEYSADIVSVNGTAVSRTRGGPAAPSTTTARPTGGQITFTIDGDGADRVRPVVHTNTRTGALELAADDRPIVAFGLGGVTTYTLPRATNADSGRRGLVRATTPAGDRTQTGHVDVDVENGGPLRYSYDETDEFAVEGRTVTFSQFQNEISRADVLEIGAYTTFAPQTSKFNVVTDGLTEPLTVSAEKGTDEQTTDDITVAVSGGTPTPYDAYIVERALVTVPEPANQDEVRTPPDPERPYTPVTDEPVPAGSDVDEATPGFQFLFVDKDVPEGTYSYRVRGVVDRDVSAARTDPNNETSLQPLLEARPHAVDALVTRDEDKPGQLSAGDQVKIVFSERLALLDGGEKVVVDDVDGTVVELVHGRNAVFALNPGDETVNGHLRSRERVLTIDLSVNFGTGTTTGGGVLAAGDPKGLQLPGTIIEQGGIADRAGFTFDVRASTDRELDGDAADAEPGEP